MFNKYSFSGSQKTAGQTAGLFPALMRVWRVSTAGQTAGPILIYKEYFCIRLRFKTLNPLPLQLRNHLKEQLKDWNNSVQDLAN